MLRRLSLLAAIPLAVIPLAATANAAAVGASLVATVGPGFDIALTRGGRPVQSLPAGRYRLTVRDRSRIHDFHPIGRGVNRVVTTVGFTGSKTITVALQPGRYRYICDPHAFVMHGSFRVT